MKSILLLALFTAFSTYLPAGAFTRHEDPALHFKVSLKYNPDAERYEVYAQPNFTQRHFLLGPSQISVIVPRQVADQSLAIYSATAQWTDYSNVYAPASAPEADFHGVHSLGKSIDVEKDVPLLLFFFTLKGGYIDGVRLYMNGKDPGSTQRGMMGGDFVNTLQDQKSSEFYQNGVSSTDLSRLTSEVAEAGKPSLTIFPNPATGEAVSVTARQFLPDERLKLRLFSSTGVELLSIEEDAARLVGYQLRLPRQLTGQAYLYAERLGTSTEPRAICKKLLILN